MTASLSGLTTQAIFAFLLLFCRVGSMMMTLPGLGETYIPMRIRLLFSLAIASVLFPLLAERLPAYPAGLGLLVSHLAFEIFIGAFLGTIIRLLINTLHLTGMVIATVAGLSAATLFDPNQGTQGAMVGNFLSILAVTAIFALHLDYVFFEALVSSYDLFPTGKWPAMGEVSEMVVQTSAESMRLALLLSAPLWVIGMVISLGGGLMAKLMPAMQVFFVLMPIQILGSLMVVMITLSASMLWFLDSVKNAVETIFLK
jgi:flagellar biosynthetic protein FliR